MISVAASEATLATGLKHKYSLADSTDAPCILMVHGRAGNMDVMWAFKRCIPDGCTIIAPEAPLTDPIGGYSWWHLNSEFKKEDAIDAANRLIVFIDEVFKYYSLIPKKLIAIGFSQGGAVLSLALQRVPQKFTGVGLLASFTIKHPEGFIGVSKPDVFIGHGTKDEVVPIEKANYGAEYLRQNGVNVTVSTDEVGHKLGTNSMRALKDWISKQLA